MTIEADIVKGGAVRDALLRQKVREDLIVIAMLGGGGKQQTVLASQRELQEFALKRCVVLEFGRIGQNQSFH